MSRLLRYENALKHYTSQELETMFVHKLVVQEVGKMSITQLRSFMND